MDEAAEALSREYQVSGSMDEVSAAEFDALRELVLKTRAKSNKDRLILASFGRSIASYHYHRVVAICENNPALNADDEFIVKGFADLLCLLGNLSSDLEAVTKTTAQKLGALTPDNSLH